MPTVTNDGVYYVDLSDSPLFITFTSVYPEGCSFDHMIRGVGNISFQLSYSALDQDGNPAVGAFTTATGSWIGPYRSYWRLRYGDQCILAGVITAVNSKLRSDYMNISGKTWEHFFEKWQYPFDPRGDVGYPWTDPVNLWRFPKTYIGNEVTATGAETPTGLVYQAQSRDLIQIWGDILAATMNVPYRVPLDMTDLISGLVGITYSMHFGLGEDRTMLDFTNDLADTGNGFDWWIGWDRAIHFGHPFRFGTVTTPFSFASVDENWVNDGRVIDSEFTNEGPGATHIFARGSGLAKDTGLGRAYGSTVNEERYSRLDRSFDYGTVKNVNRMIARAQRELAKNVQPKHTIPVSFDPGLITNFWLDFRTGRAIHLNIDYGFHVVNNYFQLLSYTAELDLDGNAVANFTTDQIYDYSLNSGTPEG